LAACFLFCENCKHDKFSFAGSFLLFVDFPKSDFPGAEEFPIAAPGTPHHLRSDQTAFLLSWMFRTNLVDL
jgi:hypothetical protein